MKKAKLLRALLFLAASGLSLPGARPFWAAAALWGLCALIQILRFGALFSSREHLGDSLVLLAPDLAAGAALLLVLPPLPLLPLLGLQAVELVLEERGPLLRRSYLGLICLTLAAGFLMRGRLRELLLILPAPAAVLLLIKMVRLQDDRNKKRYEYMKNLVDNKNKLLSTLTHELRTPLAVITTSNELILEERPGPLNATQKSLIASSLENTRRLNALVENILSQVKVEFAWFSMKRRPLDIRRTIRKTALDIGPFLESRGQKVKYSYPSLLSKTLGDRRWLEQVLLNLIHNGSKNSPDGAVIHLTVQENEQCIVVSVHDSGRGIENREIPRVFNEFYQSADPAKDPGEGAGLGLTIVRDIIKKHEGRVYISSLPGSGTTVSFTLPLYKGVFSGTNHSDH